MQEAGYDYECKFHCRNPMFLYTTHQYRCLPRLSKARESCCLWHLPLGLLCIWVLFSTWDICVLILLIFFIQLCISHMLEIPSMPLFPSCLFSSHFPAQFSLRYFIIKELAGKVRKNVYSNGLRHLYSNIHTKHFRKMSIVQCMSESISSFNPVT